MFQNVGRALDHLRARTGKSQAALARAAGIGKSQISKYVQGKELPRLESLERILGALGLGYIDFFWLLNLLDRDASAKPFLRRDEIEESLTRLTRDLFALHGAILDEISINTFPTQKENEGHENDAMLRGS
jgi:transcriptional regulator with XRE-family HTH domain